MHSRGQKMCPFLMRNVLAGLLLQMWQGCDLFSFVLFSSPPCMRHQAPFRPVCSKFGSVVSGVSRPVVADALICINKLITAGRWYTRTWVARLTVLRYGMIWHHERLGQVWPEPQTITKKAKLTPSRPAKE